MLSAMAGGRRGASAREASSFVAATRIAYGELLSRVNESAGGGFDATGARPMRPVRRGSTRGHGPEPIGHRGLPTRSASHL